MSEKLNINNIESSKSNDKCDNPIFGTPMTLREFKETYPEDTTMAFTDTYIKVMDNFHEHIDNDPDFIKDEANSVLDDHKRKFIEYGKGNILPSYDVEFDLLPDRLSKNDRNELMKDPKINNDILANDEYLSKDVIKLYAKHNLAMQEIDKYQDEIIVSAKPSLKDMMDSVR